MGLTKPALVQITTGQVEQCDAVLSEAVCVLRPQKIIIPDSPPPCDNIFLGVYCHDLFKNRRKTVSRKRRTTTSDINSQRTRGQGCESNDPFCEWLGK